MNQAESIRRRAGELALKLGEIEFRTEPVYTITYNFDATGRRGECAGVAFPRSPEEISRIVRTAGGLDLPLFARGAGTGFSGGALPTGGGVVVSTERIGKVIALDPDNLEVEVESGIINGELQDYLARRGFFYPPDPASLKVSTIGGNIAENAGGPRAYKYGVTRRYLRSVRWITPDGSIVDSPLEGAAALLPGAEGTMGIIYSARLSILHMPVEARTCLVAAGGTRQAIDRSSELLTSGFCPAVIEFIDSKTMQCVTDYREISGLGRDTCYLFVEMDGSLDEVEAQHTILDDFCRKRGLFKITARDELERDILWELRRSISPSLARKGITKINEDVSLPLGSLGEAVSFIKMEAERFNLDCYIFGHCGDGNLHVNIMTDRRKAYEMARAQDFVEGLFERVVELGGTLSGEHGIGITKSGYLPKMFSPLQLMFQRGVRCAFDPQRILNRDKYFDTAV